MSGKILRFPNRNIKLLPDITLDLNDYPEDPDDIIFDPIKMTEGRQTFFIVEKSPESKDIDDGVVPDVHTEHCCEQHGCKYGDGRFCTVMNRFKPQSIFCQPSCPCSKEE